jgi:hypothetical protein
MKLTKLLCSALLLVTFFTFSHCKKKDVPQLPPETETGAMTFGCKINGEIFVPQDGRGRSGLRVEYVNLGIGPEGGWYLSIPAVNQVPANSIGISIVTDSLLVLEGMNYQFGVTKGSAKARYYVGLDNYPIGFNDKGSLFVKKHDLSQRILSCTFSFTATNSTGIKVNITEGRFDIRY